MQEDIVEQIIKVAEFRTAFKLPIHLYPTEINQVDKQLHVRLLMEEVKEYANSESLTEDLDALTDILYLIMGAVLHQGLQDVIIDAFNRVHVSNMSKLDENGKPIYDLTGKVMKSNLYKKVNLKDLVE